MRRPLADHRRAATGPSAARIALLAAALVIAVAGWPVGTAAQPVDPAASDPTLPAELGGTSDPAQLADTAQPATAAGRAEATASADADQDAEPTGTPAPPEPADDARARLAGLIQILTVEAEPGADPEVDRGVVLEVAVPETIGLLGPEATDFAVADGGQLVGVAVEVVEDPSEVIVVLDTSGSMAGEPLAAARTAAARFVDGLPDDTRVGLVSFGETVTVHREPTTDRDRLLVDLATIDRADGETALWDALTAAAGLLDASEDAGPTSVIVLTDGGDTASAGTRTDAVAALRGASALLYAVAIETPEEDQAALETAAVDVGGQFLATGQLDQLGDLYADIAGRLANRYRLRFDLAGDGARTVVVSVAVDGSVATARVVIDGPSGTPPGDDENDDRGGAAGVPTGPSDPSPSVVVASTGFWSDARLLPIGLGAVFASLFVVGLLAARPAARIRLEAASSADRLAGFHTRLGNAVDRLVSRHALGRRLDLQLDAANISLRAGEFVIGWVAIAIPLALVLAATGRPLVGLLVLVVLVAATVGTLRVRAERRRTRFADQLTDTLAILASSLRAGQSLPRSVELVATESPAPTGPEFHRIAFEVRVGRDLTESMRDAADRLQSPDLAWLAQAVDINRELGGDLTQILDNVAGTIRERRTVARQIEALSAEGRATGWMLEGMPVVLFFFSWWRTPQHIDRLLNETAGRILLGIALSGMVIGHLWIRRLVRLRY